MKVCEIQERVAVSEIRRQLAVGTRLAAVERPHSAGRPYRRAGMLRPAARLALNSSKQHSNCMQVPWFIFRSTWSGHWTWFESHYLPCHVGCDTKRKSTAAYKDPFWSARRSLQLVFAVGGFLLANQGRLICILSCLIASCDSAAPEQDSPSPALQKFQIFLGEVLLAFFDLGTQAL